MRDWIKASLHILCKEKQIQGEFFKMFFPWNEKFYLHNFTSRVLLKLISSKYTGLKIGLQYINLNLNIFELEIS